MGQVVRVLRADLERYIARCLTPLIEPVGAADKPTHAVEGRVGTVEEGAALASAEGRS